MKIKTFKHLVAVTRLKRYRRVLNAPFDLFHPCELFIQSQGSVLLIRFIPSVQPKTDTGLKIGEIKMMDSGRLRVSGKKRKYRIGAFETVESAYRAIVVAFLTDIIANGFTGYPELKERAKQLDVTLTPESHHPTTRVQS